MEELTLNVLAVIPLSSGLVTGGVRTQARQTVNHLKKVGVNVDLFNPWDPVSPKNYDLIHVFQAGVNTLSAVRQAAGSGVPLAVSPVFYTRRSPAAIKSAIRLEALIKPFIQGIVSEFGIKAEICRSASIILPNTKDEAQLIEKGFGIDSNKIYPVPNGVNAEFINAKPDLFFRKFGLKNFVLFAGDASSKRKNLIKLIKAFETIEHDLVIIGSFKNDSYSKKCLDLANKNDRILLIDTVAHNDPILASAFAAARAFVLPSQFETPGIAALEAALAGCKIAITECGGTREYFGEESFYLNPASVSSIKKAVTQAIDAKEDDRLKNRILENYTWEIIAGKTLQAYQRILQK